MSKNKSASVRILVDHNIQKTIYGPQLLPNLLKEGHMYETTKRPIRNSISINRIIQSGNEQEEPFCIVIMDYEVLMPLIKTKELQSRVKDIMKSAPDIKIVLALCGVSTYFRKTKDKTKKNVTERPVHRSEFEWAVTELQILLGVDHRVLNNAEEFCLFVKQFAKSVAEIPLKKELYEKDLLTDGCAMDRQQTIAVSGSHGLSRLFKEQLMSFTGVTLEIAEAIMNVYPTIRSLIEAYEESSACEGAALLSTIPIRRNIQMSNTRKIGPEISRRIYLYYMSDDKKVIIDERD